MLQLSSEIKLCIQPHKNSKAPITGTCVYPYLFIRPSGYINHCFCLFPCMSLPSVNTGRIHTRFLEECLSHHQPITGRRGTRHVDNTPFQIYPVSPKRPPFYFLNNSGKKLTDFNNFWYVKSSQNLTRTPYRLVHLNYQM